MGEPGRDPGVKKDRENRQVAPGDNEWSGDGIGLGKEKNIARANWQKCEGLLLCFMLLLILIKTKICGTR